MSVKKKKKKKTRIEYGRRNEFLEIIWVYFDTEQIQSKKQIFKLIMQFL